MLLLSLLINWHLSASELSKSCAMQIASYQQAVQSIARPNARRNASNVPTALEHATDTFNEATAPEIFLETVSPDRAVDAASNACARGVESARDDVAANPTLLAALHGANDPLAQRWMKLLMRGGASLAAPRRADLLNRKRELRSIIDQNGRYAQSVRDRIAHLLGYESWLDYALANRMAQNPMRVEKFLQTSVDAIKPAAEKQEGQLRDAFAASQGRRKRAMLPSDVPRAEYLLELRAGVDEHEFRKSFATQQTHEKALALLGTLLGLSIAPVSNADTWSPNVRTYEVSDGARHRAIGKVYLDVSESADAPTALRVTTLLLHHLVAITGSSAPHLEHQDVVATLHADASAIAALLADAPYDALDFADAPPQALAALAWNQTALMQLAAPSISEDLAAKVAAMRSLHAAYDIYQRVLAAQSDTTGDGYAQLWSNVYAADLFTAFDSGTELDPAIGERFRETVLAPAGTVAPDSEVLNFLGRPMSPNAFYQEVAP